MKILIGIIFCCVALCQFSSCLDSGTKPELPAITSDGKNTFGCLLNGAVWIPTGRTFAPPINVDATALDIDVTWGARRSADGFIFFIRSPIQVNHTYDLRDTANVRVIYSFNPTSQTICIYEQYQVTSGSLTISRWDPPKSVFAGVFKFDAYNSSCRPDTLRVDQGRFDIGDITF